MGRTLTQTVILIFLISGIQAGKAQAVYYSDASYALHKIVPSYAGSAIKIRRTCDNGTTDIGFTSCGDLNTTALSDFVVVANPLSAISSTSAGCYSVRRLSCSYAGNCMTVRRSSDNTTQNIGFTTNGDLDTTSLKTFVGAGSGYVTTWFDQSGNSRNASQATSGSQPRIVNAGTIDRLNGVPAIYFGGLSYGLHTANASNIYNTAACFNGVAKVSTDLTYNAIVNKTGTAGSNNIPAPLDFYNAQLVVGNGTNYTFVGSSQTFNAAKGYSIWTYQVNGTNANGVNAWCNSTQVITNQTASYCGDKNTGLYIGSRADGVTGLNGWVSEIVTFGSIPSSTDRAYLEYTQGKYYGISGPSLGTLPASPASAYITKWYDQSGNGKDLSQATTGNQPRIVNAGVTDLSSSLPSIHFDGSSQYVTGTAFSSAFNNTVGGTLNTIAVNNGASAWQGLAQQGRNSSPWWGIWGSNTGKWTGGFSNGPGNMVSAVNSSVLQSTSLIQIPSTSTTLYGNGSSISSSATTANSANAQSFYVGYATTGTEYWNGYASEVNVFSSNIGTTRRVLMESNQAAYYSISMSGTKYTVASGYNLFVNGVGRTSTSDSVAATRQSAGMGFIVGTTATDFLQDNGDYMTIGMSCPLASTSLSNLPASSTERWANDWYLNKTDVGSNNGDIQIYFDFSEYGVGGTPGIPNNYQLLGRSSTAGTFSVVPTTTVSVSGDRVIFTLPAANLGSTGYYTIGTTDYVSSNLPISLLSFTAKPLDKKVQLNWSTATETNNKFFTVERSSDGSKFNTLLNKNSKAPNGNSLTKLDYEDFDYHPLSGTSFYRLKQTDYNGKSETFQIVSVSFTGSRNVLFVVYPNPGQGQFNVDFSGLENNHDIDVYLHDVQGKEVYHNVYSTQDESGTFSIIPTEKIAPGTYFASFYLEGVKYQVKVLVN